MRRRKPAVVDGEIDSSIAHDVVLAFPSEAALAAVDSRDVEAYCWAHLRHIAANGDYFISRYQLHYVAAAVERYTSPLVRLKIGGLGDSLGEPGAWGAAPDPAAADAFKVPETEDEQ